MSSGLNPAPDLQALAHRYGGGLAEYRRKLGLITTAGSLSSDGENVLEQLGEAGVRFDAPASPPPLRRGKRVNNAKLTFIR